MEGGVVIRCSAHDAQHGQWLVQQGREGNLPLDKVGALLCEEDSRGRFLLSLLDPNSQKETAAWNKQATGKIAHMMSTGFIQWIIKQAQGDKWSKEDVGSAVCRKNTDNQLVLATLDEETQKQVAVFNKAKTCSAVPYMEGEFLRWLYQEAVNGTWNSQMVLEVLAKDEVDEKVVITAKNKQGK